MKKNLGVRLLTVGMAMLMSVEPLSLQAQGSAAYDEAAVYADLLSNVYEVIFYDDYLTQYKSGSRPYEEVSVLGGDFIEADAGFVRAEGYEGYNGDVALTLEEGSITWEIRVPESGLYNLEVEYYPIEGKNNTIERELRINGELPFDGAQYLEFSRIWMDANEIRRDARDNDVRPTQVEAAQWLSAYCKDSSGYEAEPYLFYFEEGVNTITLTSVKEPMAVGKITLTQWEAPVSYAEYIEETKSSGIAEVSMLDAIKIQGEDAVYKSESTIYPVSDRTSPLTEPYHASKIRMNTIGGSNWNQVGQWATWEVTVPKDGLYEIAVKYNIFVDEKNFVYATISNLSDEDLMNGADAVRRLNPTGTDVLRRLGNNDIIGDLYSTSDDEDWSMFTDIAATDFGAYFILDNAGGKVFCYDYDGNSLFIFGGKGGKAGMCKNPTALGLAEDASRIYILDAQLGSVLVYDITQYGECLLGALEAHHDGNSTKAYELWQEVLQRNANSEVAYTGIGKTYLKEGHYKEAMEYFELGNSRKYYTKAFQFYRKELMQENFGKYMGVVCIAVVLVLLAGVIKKLKRWVGEARCNISNP